MKRDKVKIRCGGFSLVELLTTLAVIGVLLGLLIPALSQVSKMATKVKQKAQFHAIGSALEAFRNDTGDYPPSEWDTTKYGKYSASQRLAEAMVGRDGLGFHPNSRWHETGEDITTKSLYRNHADFNVDYPAQVDKDANLSARKGPYLELENANAVRLGALYNPIPAGTLVDSLVLVDVFKIVKNADTQKTVGTPILYYKPNKFKTEHGGTALPQDCTYNINDSLGSSFDGLASLKPLIGGIQHPLKTDYTPFYEATANPNFTTPKRPYRAESFLLHSAGPDGLYGTTDDLFNFDQDN